MEGNRPLVEIETGFMKDIEDFVPSSQEDLDYGFLDSAIEWLLPKLCCGCACVSLHFIIFITKLKLNFYRYSPQRYDHDTLIHISWSTEKYLLSKN